MPFELKRIPKSLSYSSYSLYYKDPDEFFIRYLAGTRAPRLPQENFMSVGSAFDAYVKAALHSAVFGPHADPAFEFDKLFTDQVEEHNRDWALVTGKHVFDNYVFAGSYAELLALLLKSIEPPVFETSLDGFINGVPFLGKPDLRFMLQFYDLEPARIVFDWKVKGYCSKYGASPSQGYALCRDAIGWPKPSQSHMKSHKLYLPYDHRGLTINQGFMETCNDEYADQVSCYGWLLGEKPGDENVVVWIDETLAKYMGPDAKPLLRIANHRARVSRDHQLALLEKITGCWNAITSGHIFRDMSREDSDNHCEVLDQMAVGLQTDGSDQEDWFNQVTRPQFKR